MVPHAVITVSLATAMLPLLSSHGNRRRPAQPGRQPGPGAAHGARGGGAVRGAAARASRPDLAAILWNWGAASSTYTLYILSLSLFGAGIVFFTVHYLVLRGFYALERTRTVFLIQCAVAATNIVAAVVLVASTDAEHTAPALVVAYTASYVVGSVLSYLVLRRTLAAGGRRRWRRAALVRFVVRLAIATGIATFAAWGVAMLLPGHDDPGHLLALVRLVLVAGADVLVFLVLARLMRLTEVTDVIDTVTRRLRRRTAERADRTYDEQTPRSVAWEEDRAARDPPRRRPGRPLPAGRPARRERGWVVLPGPRRLPRPLGRGAHHPRRRRRAPSCCARPRARPRAWSTAGCCGCSTSTRPPTRPPATARPCATSSTSGRPASRSTSCSPTRVRSPRGARPGSSARWPRPSRWPTPPAWPTAAWCPRTS